MAILFFSFQQRVQHRIQPAASWKQRLWSDNLLDSRIARLEPPGSTGVAVGRPLAAGVAFFMAGLLFAYSLLAIWNMPLQNHLLLWRCIGFAGLGCFQARWVVQWLYSEKHRESKVPSAFWWLSLSGALIETCYFLRQHDPVGIAGYCISFIPYVRNLMLIYAKKARDAKEAPGFDVVAQPAIREVQ